MTMTFMRSFVVTLLLLSQSASEAVVGHLSTNRNKIRAGEPFEIRFEAVNRGHEAIEIKTVAPELAMCGHFRVKVSRRGMTAEFPPPIKGPDIIGSCLYATQDIAPRHKYIESFWIGGDHELSIPGTYHVDVTYKLVYNKLGLPVRESPLEALFHSGFDIRVLEAEE